MKSFFTLLLILIFSLPLFSLAQQVKYTYHHTDHLGSITVSTDKDGRVVEVTDYLSYGQQQLRYNLAGQSEQRKYIGQEYDPSTNLNYLNSRYYDSNSSRFLSQDPVFWLIGDEEFKGRSGKSLQEFLSDPQLLDSYSYGRDDPIIYKDPDGKDAVITFNERNKTVTIKATIFIHGKGATSDVANRMENNIMAEWNKGWTFKDGNTNTTYSVNFDIDVKTTKYPWLHGYAKDSNVIKIGDVDRSSVNAKKAKSGVWRGNAPDPAPHEFGHLLGLDDRYVEGGGPQPGWKGNVMSEPAMQGRVEQKNVDTIIQPYARKHNNRWFPKVNKITSHHIAPRNGNFR